MTPAGSVSSFPSSHWSLIARAGGSDPEQARTAMAELCGRYWYPLYAFVRRKVGSAADAEDVTQGFFAHVLEQDLIARVEPARGRFRTYLLACCKYYLSNCRRTAGAEKRGGKAVIFGIDFETAATRYAQEPADPHDPDAVYLRRWAITLLEETFAALENDYGADGATELYVRLRPTLTNEAEAQTYASIAGAVGMTEPAVRKAAQRLRDRFARELRRRIADTVDDPGSVEDEIRQLFAAVR